MNTLADLKRLLDEGETLTDGKGLMWKAPFPNQYTINHNLSTVTLDWEDILYLVAPNPSLWRQRDQIGAEKPVMMAVPIEQWDALQEELTELRQYKWIQDAIENAKNK